jgi:hypothetical protein
VTAQSIYVLLNKVMDDVGAVRKEDKNQHQRFMFRGIDAVVKAVYPALVKHGVIVVPNLLEHRTSEVTVGSKRTPMSLCIVTVRYTFWGPAGDSVETTVAAEAMDSGDKATPKAMSVAFRTALLQALCLPTDEEDPDASSYARSEPVPDAATVHDRLEKTAESLGKSLEEVTAKWREQHGGIGLDEFMALPPEDIYPFVKQLWAYAQKQSKKQ